VCSTHRPQNVEMCVGIAAMRANMNTSTVSVDVAGTVMLAFSVAKLAGVSITGSDFSKLTSVVCFVAFAFRKVTGTIGRFYVILS